MYTKARLVDEARNGKKKSLPLAQSVLTVPQHQRRGYGKMLCLSIPLNRPLRLGYDVIVIFEEVP